jgi:acyl-CoA synthetase (AMP-forming)/AMP-acid ligase II
MKKYYKPVITPSRRSSISDPHILMDTSGTTGLAKGTVLSHQKTFFNGLNADLLYTTRVPPL